jgi:hypothetical protein
MSHTKEKIAMFDEAIVYHSGKDVISNAEIEWVEWARKRVIELEKGGEA